MRPGETWIGSELEARRRDGLERTLTCVEPEGPYVTVAGRRLLNASSNDYLALARHPHVIARARGLLEQYGAGATASRLVCGTLACHEELEQQLARFKAYPATLVFGSGYAANVGLIPALAGRGDQVFVDRLAHASLVDGAILSRAAVHRFRHNDAAHLDHLLKTCTAGGRRLVATESVFSMDGDLAPLQALADIVERHDAMLMVDEAHATGVFGPMGSGCVRGAGLESSVTLSMGTLSKALGSQGGFVACSQDMRALLVQSARSFVYSTALAPAAVGAALGALEVLAREPELGARLLARAAALRSRLQTAGLDTAGSASHIVPVLVGDAGRTLRVAARIREAGVLAIAIRPPTVPAGSSRLRLSVSLGHSDADLDRLAGAVIDAMRREA